MKGQWMTSSESNVVRRTSRVPVRVYSRVLSFKIFPSCFYWLIMKDKIKNQETIGIYEPESIHVKLSGLGRIFQITIILVLTIEDYSFHFLLIVSLHTMLHCIAVHKCLVEIVPHSNNISFATILFAAECQPCDLNIYSAGCVEFGPEVTSSDKSLKVMLNSQDKVRLKQFNCSIWEVT